MLNSTKIKVNQSSQVSKEYPAAVEIQIKGLHKAFGEKRVLCGIDLDICNGDVIAIVGGSGCGKTVLLNHMLGQLVPNTGSVLVANHAPPKAPIFLIRTSLPSFREYCGGCYYEKGSHVVILH